MSHIFISYSKKNREYATQLADELRRRGFDIWIDDQIEPSEDWWRNIRQAIRSCAAFTIVMTPESESSHWVQLELLHALEFKKPIFPLFLAGDPNPLNSDTWSRIANIQFTNVQQQNLPANFWYEKIIARGVPSASSSGKNIIPSPLPPASSGSSNLAELTHRTIAILPPPFEWCDIPDGKVTIEYSETNKKEFLIEHFAISKYPITNAQFDMFVNAKDGYNNPAWWDYAAEAYAWRKEKSQPEETAFTGDDLPRTNVSWYEAIAFCRWLSTRLDTNILLPTEQQWQRAAQGDDRRKYPWHNDFDMTRCNTSESRIASPTSVTMYPNGASCYGVMDLSGNIWEWCSSLLRDDQSALSGVELLWVQRGGAFKFNHSYAAVSVRTGYYPGARSYFFGFRVMLAVP